MTAELQPLTDPAAARYRERYDAARADLPGAERGWIVDLRDRAAAALVANGFPTRRVEAWKYTDLRRVLRAEFAAPARPGTPDAATLASCLPDDGPVAVFVDGAFCASLSRLGGDARLVPLAAALDAGDATAERLLTASGAIEEPGLGALNTALMTAQSGLSLSKHARIARTGGAWSTRRSGPTSPMRRRRGSASTSPGGTVTVRWPSSFAPARP